MSNKKVNATTTATTPSQPTQAQVNNAERKAAKASKKGAAPNPAPAPGTVIPTPVVSPTPEPAAAATPAKKGEPFGGKKAEPFKPLGERDAYGFGQDTETSWLLAHLGKGTYTKETLLAAFLAKFVPDNNAAEQKRKKTSFSVFFSDVRKPFGTYHASRSLEIVADKDTGILTITPASVERCQKAIKAKVLDDLRGLTVKKHREKIGVVLKKHNLPGLEAAK